MRKLRDNEFYLLTSFRLYMILIRKSKDMLERFKQLLGEMNRGIYEKGDGDIALLLAALAGESIILLGPPGVAKSMVARQLKTAFVGCSEF